jgi:hypothetical protein
MALMLFLTTVDAKGNGGAKYSEAVMKHYLSAGFEVVERVLSMNHDKRKFKLLWALFWAFRFQVPLKVGYLISSTCDLKGIQELYKISDIVVFDHAESMIAFDMIFGINKKSYLVEHNDEVDLYLQRLTGFSKYILYADYLYFRYRYELALKKINTVFCISTVDVERILAKGYKAEYLPMLFDRSDLAGSHCRLLREKIVIGMIGDFRWWPNSKGLSWFVKEVMPILNDCTLSVAGVGSEELCRSFDVEGVDGLGYVDSLENYINSVDIFVAPIYGGSGVNVKVLDMMIRGKYQIISRQASNGIKFLKNIDVVNDDVQSWVASIEAIIEQGYIVVNMNDLNIYILGRDFE